MTRLCMSLMSEEEQKKYFPYLFSYPHASRRHVEATGNLRLLSLMSVSLPRVYTAFFKRVCVCLSSFLPLLSPCPAISLCGWSLWRGLIFTQGALTSPSMPKGWEYNRRVFGWVVG